MFVFKKKYDEAVAEKGFLLKAAEHDRRLLEAYRQEVLALQRRVAAEIEHRQAWEQECARLGQLVIANSASGQFNQEEIKRLLMLCHPDKHGGKKMAVDMTVRLLAMRATARA